MRFANAQIPEPYATARHLGSSAVAVYEAFKPTTMDEEEMFDILGQRLARSMQKEPISDTMALYAKLGQQANPTSSNQCFLPGNSPLTLPRRICRHAAQGHGPSGQNAQYAHQS